MALVPFPGAQTGAAPEPEPEEDPDGSAGKMSFLEHLDELRRRITHAVAGIAVGVLIAFAFIDRIFDFVFRPMQKMLPPGSKLIYTEPTEAFTLYLQIALLAGIVISAPYIMWQIWKFIAPGLYQKEKRFAIPFVLLTTSGFVGGAAFTHYICFPYMWMYLASFSNDYVAFTPKLDPVFDLYVKMMLGMGLVFQMPTVVYFLARMGLVTARFLWDNFKYAILIIFVVAAVVTPSGDALTQTIFALPMIGLYIISIAIAWAFGKRRRKAAAAAGSDAAD